MAFQKFPQLHDHQRLKQLCQRMTVSEMAEELQVTTASLRSALSRQKLRAQPATRGRHATTEREPLSTREHLAAQINLDCSRTPSLHQLRNRAGQVLHVYPRRHQEPAAFKAALLDLASLCACWADRQST